MRFRFSLRCLLVCCPAAAFAGAALCVALSPAMRYVTNATQGVVVVKKLDSGHVITVDQGSLFEMRETYRDLHVTVVEPTDGVKVRRFLGGVPSYMDVAPEHVVVAYDPDVNMIVVCLKVDRGGVRNTWKMAWCYDCMTRAEYRDEELDQLPSHIREKLWRAVGKQIASE